MAPEASGELRGGERCIRSRCARRSAAMVSGRALHLASPSSRLLPSTDSLTTSHSDCVPLHQRDAGCHGPLRPSAVELARCGSRRRHRSSHAAATKGSQYRCNTWRRLPRSPAARRARLGATTRNQQTEKRVVDSIQAAAALPFGLSERHLAPHQSNANQTVERSRHRGSRSPQPPGDFRHAVGAGTNGIERRADFKRRRYLLDQQAIRFTMEGTQGVEHEVVELVGDARATFACQLPVARHATPRGIQRHQLRGRLHAERSPQIGWLDGAKVQHLARLASAAPYSGS